MELIYLWIKGYKNIRELGVSLNPNFKESQATTFSNNTLDIHLINCEYTNIFVKNYNVMTIVGSNGSGKTNLSNAIISILRKNLSFDSNTYYDYSLPNKYFLLIKQNDEFKQITNCSNIEISIDGKSLLNTEIENITKNINCNCGVFRPFLNIDDDSTLLFPKYNHMEEIVNHKVQNYFYNDRFRMYDTNQALRSLFIRNQKEQFEFLSNNNEYLVSKFYGYEINIEQEFAWLNLQLDDKVFQYYKRENLGVGKVTEFVDMLTNSNNFIIRKAKEKGYFDIDEFINIVISNGCFMFVIIKMAELFSLAVNFDNFIDLYDLKDIFHNVVELKPDSEDVEILINLNENNYKRKHKELKDFYTKIQKRFINAYDNNSSVQYIEKSFLVEFSTLLTTCIKLETDLFNEKFSIRDLFYTKNGNLYKPKNQFLVDITQNNLNEEMAFLNNLGIFRLSFYDKNSIEYNYSFYDLSTGEQRILRFFADILSLEKKDIQVFVFDEMDLSWHPEWQRKMIYYINDFFEKLDIPFCNLIFTTHSPFILSDMQKNNVIMLYRDKQGFAKKFNEVPNCFGANIHDLFNNNFFFSDCEESCIIGEVAKMHIKNIQEDFEKYKEFFYDEIFYHSINIDKNIFLKKVLELKNRILIIGEPVIRNALYKEWLSYPYIKYLLNPRNVLLDYIKLEDKYNELKRILDEKNRSD